MPRSAAAPKAFTKVIIMRYTGHVYGYSIISASYSVRLNGYMR